MASAPLVSTPSQDGCRHPEGRGSERSPLTDAGYRVEHRRMKGCCLDCGRKYGDEYGFPDLVIPHDIWAKLSPTGDEGGLLCPSCMCRRAHDAGIENVEAKFTSGPFRTNREGDYPGD